MKQKKRIHAFLSKALGAVLVLGFIFAFTPTAHAEEARINITANPTELTDAGLVTFTFEIANYNSTYPMSDVAITYNSTVYNILSGAQIPPSGSARDITLTLNVSQSQLGKPITFLLTWTRNGEPMRQEAQYTIAQAENPIITVTRTADKTNAKPGEKVTITYTIKNTTKFDMTNITLIDENISDSPIFQDETLRASRATSYDFPYVMGDESVTSAPVVTYTVNGKAKTFSSLDPLELVMVRIQLDMRVQMGTPTSSGVTFTLDVVNSGTQAISSISISDERGNPVNDAPFNLAPGESRSLSYVVVPLMTQPVREVKFLLTGTDPFSQPYSLTPEDIYEVYPYIDEAQINVTVRAETITPWTRDSGTVSARIIIINHSSVELTSVKVTEIMLGLLEDFDVLPIGQTSFDRDLKLGSPRNLSITVRGHDPTGTNRLLGSYEMPIAYGTEAAPEATATPEPVGGGSFSIFGGISDGISRILIILGVLMVLSLVILVVLTAMERSRTPQRYFDTGFDDYSQDPYVPHARTYAYHDEPDSDEISYTKRMFAVRDEEPFIPEEPIRLPALKARPAEQPPVVFAPTPQPESTQAETPQAEELAQRLVETARTRYTQAQSSAAYRPVSEDVKPFVPEPEQPRASTPRVFDYKKQPKPQTARKSPVTRIQKSGRYSADDEE